MFLAHSIRLRDPWQCEPADDGRLRWSRVFHRPTGLEPDDQLVLVLTGAPPTAHVTINGHPFPPASERAVGFTPTVPSQYDLTPILIDDNRIEILVSPPTPNPSFDRELRAERQPPAPAPFPYDARLAIIGHS